MAAAVVTTTTAAVCELLPTSPSVLSVHDAHTAARLAEIPAPRHWPRRPHSHLGVLILLFFVRMSRRIGTASQHFVNARESIITKNKRPPQATQAQTRRHIGGAHSSVVLCYTPHTMRVGAAVTARRPLLRRQLACNQSNCFERTVES